MKLTCECSDKGCEVGHGAACTEPGVSILYRVDMDDATGTLFCQCCGDDAMDSGLFSIGEDAFDDKVQS